MDNNNDSILEISDFLNCIPDSTSISFSLYLLILGTDKEGNMKFNEELDPEGKGRFTFGICQVHMHNNNLIAFLPYDNMGKIREGKPAVQ